MSTEMLTRLTAKQEEARKEKDTLIAQRAAIVQLAEDEAREDLDEKEDTEFRDLTTKIAAIDDDIVARGERIQELADEEKRSDNADLAVRRSGLVAANLRVTKESRTYEKGNGRSYFADLAISQVMGNGEARARLDRHAMEVASDPEYRDLDRTDGTGGFLKVAAVAA